MSSIDPDENTDPGLNLTPAEMEDLHRLEAIAQCRLGSYVLVDNALGEIRDRHLYRATHPSFETYVRGRWGLGGGAGSPLSQSTIPADADATSAAEREPRTPLGNKPCEALARACEETLSAFEDDDRLGVEIRVVVRNQGSDTSEVSRSIGSELLPTLRWLLTQASGTIGEVGHQLETRAADIDDGARAQLRDDVLVIDGELAVVKALLLELTDWDAELTRLLEQELPPLDTDPDPDDDE
jgi:hypothetical protein